GTHGRSGLPRILLGSVTEAVVQHGITPVLLVPAATTRPPAIGPYRRILVPLDGSRFAEGALAYLVQEQLGHGAELLLLEAVPPAVTVVGHGPPWRDHDAQLAAEQRLFDAREYLEDLGHHSLKGWAWRSHVAVGFAAKAILDLAGAAGVDLVVMATHGDAERARLAHGSVAGHVVHHGQVPLLILHGAPWGVARTA
ncbi:MAG TPA: universal stress protein, partial [Chloroflexota bacterium]|nr:universal stress protein [Chloroflexota bacterium]